MDHTEPTTQEMNIGEYEDMHRPAAGVKESELDERLRHICFPVTLADVYVGHPPRPAERYQAIVPLDEEGDGVPFSIVTDKYRLISNKDVVELAYEAFARLFPFASSDKMTVFNVVMAKGRGSFFADFTAPELHLDIPVRRHDGSVSEPEGEPDRHIFFLRISNSYNRTQAVRFQVGVCRWICKNGIIFGAKSIRLRDAHRKTRSQLSAQIQQGTELPEMRALQTQIGVAYRIPLPQNMAVLEGVWQTLALNIPLATPEHPAAQQWRDRCGSLRAISSQYETSSGMTAFSVLQAASQWCQTSPQRYILEERCGQMLDSLMESGRWPDREEKAEDQVRQIDRWAHV